MDFRPRTAISALAVLLAIIAAASLHLAKRGGRELASESTGAATPFGWPELQALAQSPGVRSIEDLLPKLPMDLRANFTLVTESKSVQAATKLDPRAILFGSTGRLILAFNGDATQKGGSELEVLSFDEAKGRIELREVHFGGDQPAISEANPRRCTLCHDENPRPIWPEYRNWRGAMGQEDDEIGDPPEWLEKYKISLDVLSPSFKEFKDFRDHAKDHPRYKWLGFRQDLYPFPYHYHGEGKSIETSPNARLGLLSVLNLSRDLVTRISLHPLFERFRYTLLRGLGCSEKNETSGIVDQLAPYASVPDGELWTGSREDWLTEVRTQKAILSFFGVPYGSTSTALRLDDPGDVHLRHEAGNYSAVDENTPGPQPVRGALVSVAFDSGFGARGGSQTHVAQQLLRAVAKTDPPLAQIIETHAGWAKFISHGDGSGMSPYEAELYAAAPAFVEFLDRNQALIRFKARPEICAHIIAKADEEWKGRPPAPPLPAFRPAPKEPPGMAILKQSRCIACHKSDGMDGAPRIPFEDAQAFKGYVESMAKEGNDALKLIRRNIIRPDVTHRFQDKETFIAPMPLSGAVLRLEDQKKLMDYLTKLAK